jgi:hypothetical protein
LPLAHAKDRIGGAHTVLKPAVHFQLPLYKLFLIIAVYAAAFGAWSHLGGIGFILAAIIGTIGSLLVIAIRDRKSALASAIVAVGGLLGTLLANVVFVPSILGPYSAAAGFRDWAIMAGGAVLGGVLLSWASKR